MNKGEIQKRIGGNQQSIVSNTRCDKLAVLLRLFSGLSGCALNFAVPCRSSAGPGCGSCSPANNLGFSSEPIFQLVTVSATSFLIQLVGAATDLFRSCFHLGLARYWYCFFGNSHESLQPTQIWIRYPALNDSK